VANKAKQQYQTITISGNNFASGFGAAAFFSEQKRGDVGMLSVTNPEAELLPYL